VKKRFYRWSWWISRWHCWRPT